MNQPTNAAIREAPAGLLLALQGVFTPAELDAIEAYGDSLAPAEARIGGRENDTDHIRVTRVAWFDRGPQIAWLHDRIEQAVLDMNSRFYKYDLYGLKENFQYTVYQSAEGGHYDWHVDTGTGERKLSLTLQLSDPSSYQGGDLVLDAGEGDFIVNRTRGALVFFPSYVRHRVTPVTLGTRKSLVAWVAGPPYR